MKKKKYLDFYFQWMENGTITSNGLCGTFAKWGGGYRRVAKKEYIHFDLFIPETEQQRSIKGGYWAKDGRGNDLYFGPTRQNIVLLMAAMNGEL